MAIPDYDYLRIRLKSKLLQCDCEGIICKDCRKIEKELQALDVANIETAESPDPMAVQQVRYAWEGEANARARAEAAERRVLELESRTDLDTLAYLLRDRITEELGHYRAYKATIHDWKKEVTRIVNQVLIKEPTKKASIEVSIQVNSTDPDRMHIEILLPMRFSI